MRDLNYQLKQLCARNRDGSYISQANQQFQVIIALYCLQEAMMTKLTIE